MPDKPWLIAVELGPPNDNVEQVSPPALLDTGEQARSMRFLRAEDRLAYVAAHALKRLMLAAMTGEAAASLSFRVDSHGKPHLADRSDWHFSLSHTAGLVAVACLRRSPVGVDVECLSRAAFEPNMADMLLTERESAWIKRSKNRHEAFLLLWTAKEAALKAEGTGLATKLTDVDVLEDSVLTQTRRWRLERYQPTRRHMLALAWAGDPEADEVLCQRLGESELWDWAARKSV